MTDPNWGPTGRTVFERTYSRTKPNGEKETWRDTVARVVDGNLGLVYGDPSMWTEKVHEEAQALFDAMFNFEIIPAGRHLWASGVSGRQFLFNCHVSGWGARFSDHFEFTFLRLMEGGGVGANYSTVYTSAYGAPRRALKLHVTADPGHADHGAMADNGLLSEEFADEWPGAFRVEDSREGWAAALVDLIETFWKDDVRHEDRVYSVSGVRPQGAPLRTFGGTASGPLPLAEMLHTVAEVLNRAYERGHVTPLDAMDIDHAIGKCVVAGGVRRSARMSIVKWDDPYVFEFIEAKAKTGGHWTTNISVEIDDRFLEWGPLAREVHAAVVAGMLANGEPGYWNSSLSAEGETGTVQATNPCGEITLEEWEPCNIGSVNLEAFVGKDDNALLSAHRLLTRFLIRATFGDVTDPKQREILDRNRRIGVGHMGVQGYLVRNGIRYSEAPGNDSFRELLQVSYDAVREEARDYAFALRIPEPVKVTTVAPTGSIAKLPGVTEGIHPVYAKWFLRRIRFSTLRLEERIQVEEFREAGYKVEPDLYAANTVVVEIPTKDRLLEILERDGLPADLLEDASEIALGDMLAFQAMYQTEFADNAVSFTVNVPEGAYSQEAVEATLATFLPSLKGTTLMPDGTRPQAPYERLNEATFAAITAPVAVDDSYDEACASGACPIR